MNITRFAVILTLAAGGAFGQAANVAFPGKVTAKTPGGTIPIWKKYQVTLNATDWLVNGVTAPAGEGHVSARSASKSQAFNLFQLPAGGIIDGIEIRRSAACTGTATAQIAGVGDPCGATWYDGTAYNLHPAPTNTDMRHITVTKRCTIEAAYVYITVTTTGGNVSDLSNCVIDAWVKWSVLP